MRVEKPVLYTVNQTLEDVKSLWYPSIGTTLCPYNADALRAVSTLAVGIVCLVVHIDLTQLKAEFKLLRSRPCSPQHTAQRIQYLFYPTNRTF